MSQDEDYTLYSTWNGSGAYPAGMLVNTNIIWNELMCFKQIHTWIGGALYFWSLPESFSEVSIGTGIAWDKTKKLDKQAVRYEDAGHVHYERCLYSAQSFIMINHLGKVMVV